MEISLEQAVSLLLLHTQPLTESVTLPLCDAVGLVAAEDIVSPIDNPPFDRSPLDGYALRSEDVAHASADNPVRLQVVAELFAGDPPAAPVNEAGQAVRLMTGAAIPEGCDCVVRQEDTDGGEHCVTVIFPLNQHQNYCFKGEDIRKGQLLIPARHKLGYASIGVLASVGLTEVRVTRPPRVGLLCTGDELTQPGKPLTPGKIYNGNESLLVCRLKELGVPVTTLPATSDDPEALTAQIAAAMGGLDFLITTGGVSVGKKDVMPDVLEKLGAQRIFWRISLKPGTPALCGSYQGKLILCLSGNPFAAITTMELLARPVLAAMTGRKELQLTRCKGTLQTAFSKNSEQRRFIRAQVRHGNVFFPDGHSSGELFSMLGCNALADIPAGTPALVPGDEVDFVLL